MQDKNASSEQQTEHIDHFGDMVNEKNAIVEADILHDENPADHAEVSRLLRRVDWRLMPALGVLYAFSLIDRVNLSAVSPSDS